jgi:hypothetical protein
VWMPGWSPAKTSPQRCRLQRHNAWQVTLRCIWCRDYVKPSTRLYLTLYFQLHRSSCLFSRSR